MSGPEFRDTHELLSDTDDILRMMRSNVYTADDFKSGDFYTAKSQLAALCPSFKMDNSIITCLITLTVNNLVISGCTIEGAGFVGGVKYFSARLFCSRGSNTSQKYLTDDIERYALANDATYLEITIPSKTFGEHTRLGYLPVSVGGYEDLASLGRIGISEAISATNTMKEDTIVVTKAIREDISNYLPARGQVTTPGKLDDNVSRFSGMIEVKRADLLDYKDHPTLTIPALLSPLCKQVGTDYVEDLYGDRGDNFILTIEVSGVLISFCIISFRGVSDNDLTEFFDKKRKREGASVYKPCAYINLICSMDHAYLGSYMFRQAELFALRNGVNTLRLTSDYGKVGWYTRRGMSVEKNQHDNDPEWVDDHTPLFTEALRELSGNIRDMESGVKLPPTVVQKEGINKGSCSRILLYILGQIFGKDVSTKFSTMYPDRISNVSNRLSKQGVCSHSADPSTYDEDYEFDSELEMVMDAGIAMSKKISY